MKIRSRRLLSLPILVLAMLPACIVNAIESGSTDEAAMPCWLDERQEIRSATSNLAALKTYLLPIQLNSPQKDAELRFSHGDFRFIGVGGVSVSVPGIDKVKEDEIICRYGVRYMVGTSDVIEGQEHAELIDSFREYAARYNRRMRDLLAV